MKNWLAVVLLAVAAVSAQEHDLDILDGFVCPSGGYMIPDPENLCFVWFCEAPDTNPIKRMCPKGVRVPSWWQGGELNMCFVVNIVKHGGDPVCLRCDAHDIPPVTDGCASNPCDPGCDCLDTEYTFECQCPDTGVYTDVETVPMPVDHCTPDPCENGALCQNQWDGFFCFCPNGWTGHRCEQSVCDWHACLNGGTCVIDEIGYHCECTDCWTGSCCNVTVPGCNDREPCGPCFSGSECDIQENTCGCTNLICDPGNTCVDGPEGPRCAACPDCMTGPECKARRDSCLCTNHKCPEHSVCEDVFDAETHECVCSGCWTGPSCSTPKVDCSDECNPCPAGATCYEDAAGPMCSCPECYSGDSCDVQIVSCQCNNPCGEDVKCEMINGAANCGCPDDCHYGSDCESVVNTCRCNSPCNGDYQDCSDSDDGPVCRCSDDCQYGADCESTKDTCECNPCEAGEACSDSENGRVCGCSDGCHYGPGCENVHNTCACSSPCADYEICSDSDDGPVCRCADSCQYGADCENTKDTCECSPCEAGEFCSDSEDGKVCGCSDSCHYGPGCANSYDTCECNPCDAGEVCSDSENGRVCGCSDECYYGPGCENVHNTCECNNLCADYEICSDSDDGPKCSCPPCKGGDNCQDDLNNCECNNPCKKTPELCKEGDNGPYCECECEGNEICFHDTVSGIPECRCPKCTTNARGERGCNSAVTNLCECNQCYGDQEVCSDGEDEDDSIICKIGNPSSGNSFTVVFEENDTEKSFREIPLELYITGAVYDSGERLVNIRSAGLDENHFCYFNSTITVPNNKVERFTVERCMMQNGTGLEHLAIRLTELNNQTMTVYGVNKDRWTADAFLALPDHRAGNTFQTVSYTPAHIATQFAIAALYDDTEVSIKLADDNDLPSPYNVKGAVYKIKMNAFETFQVQARCPGQRPSKTRRCGKDLTGSVIESDKQIHVFSGNVRAFIPAGAQGAKSRDHLVEELLPRDRWGMDFGLISVPRRAVGDLLTIMGVDMEETTVHVYSRINGEDSKKVYSLPDENGLNHMTIPLPSNGRYLVKSDNRLSLTQLTKSKDTGYMFGNETYHDPVSITVPSTSQFTNNFFISNPQFTGGESFQLKPYNTTLALLIAKRGEEQNIVLNGEPLSTFVEEWDDLPQSEDDADAPLVGAVITIPANGQEVTNVIRNTEGKNFQCLIYGYDDRESYGMPAAMGLSKIQV